MKVTIEMSELEAKALEFALRQRHAMIEAEMDMPTIIDKIAVRVSIAADALREV